MLKAKTDKGDLIFGLSEANIEELKKGRPISFNLKDIGLEDRQIMIMYGKTEQAIASKLGVATA